MAEWPVVEYQGTKYRRGEGFVLIPVDGSQGVAIIMVKNDGLVMSGITAVAQGDPGPAAVFQTGPIEFTELAHNDPTQGGLEVVEVSPGVYKLVGALHSGEPGTDGASVLNPESFGTPVAGYMLRVKSDLEGFEYQAQKVADRYYPAEVFASGSGEANTTLCPIPLPALPFDYRVGVRGQTVVDGTDVRVDFVARLNGETSGNVIDRCSGIASTERLVFTGAATPPSGATDTFDRVAANTTATVYVRTELQPGSSGTYTTSVATTWAQARIYPIP